MTRQTQSSRSYFFYNCGERMYLLLVCVFATVIGSVFCQNPRWCVTSQSGLERCNAIASDASKKDSANAFSCVLGMDEQDCYRKIAINAADFGVFDGGMIYHAGLEYDLRVVMAEKLSGVNDTATSYYAVAVVKKTSSLTINNIKGKKSCHTGVQKTSGWKIPVGALISKGIMKWKGCNQYATVADFFSSSCAPGANDKKYNVDMTNATQLCALCSGTGSNKCSRSSKEPFYSYEGAFKCLRDGGGDVAFIKASTVVSKADKANYKLLCLDGSTQDPDNYRSCNLARVSSHGVLARKDRAGITKIQNVLKAIDKNYGEASKSSLKLYAGGVLFSKNTVGLSEVAAVNQSYDRYLDDSYIKDVSVLERCAKWCVTQSALAACQSVANRAGDLSCVLGTSDADCYQKIATKRADIGMFDGGDIYHAGKEHKLKAILSERLSSSPDPETSYYAVAVVKTGSPLTIKTLKGKKSCHTGVRKTAGWIVPVGHLLREKLMSWTKDCNQYGSVANFFNGSCAPGANSDKYNKGKVGASKLCSLCAGVGGSKCARDSSEPYYGYAGAFKCLKDGKGDVAFVKQSTVVGSSGFKLLCKDNTKKDPKDYKTCHLARAPSHAMLARPDAPIFQYQAIFDMARKKLGADLFRPAGTLFSKDATALQNVTAAKQSYDKYLDESYMNDVAQFDSCVGSSASAVYLHVPLLALLWFSLKIIV